jgi:hypothetical protein
MFAPPGNPTQRPEEPGGWYFRENDDVMLENLDHAMASQQDNVRCRNAARPSEWLSLHVDTGPLDLIEKMAARPPA